MPQAKKMQWSPTWRQATLAGRIIIITIDCWRERTAENQ
jgi:hypothetical protein